MSQSVADGKTAAITSYILIVGALIAMSMNSEDKNPFAAFHIRQSIGLSVTFISLGLIVSPFDNLMISSAMWLFVSILWAFGLYTAITGQTKPVPLLGNLFQKIFRSK
jgi:uncharacterized membrane protein